MHNTYTVKIEKTQKHHKILLINVFTLKTNLNLLCMHRQPPTSPIVSLLEPKNKSYGSEKENEWRKDGSYYPILSDVCVR